MALRRKPRTDAKPDDKAKNEDAPRTVNGIRVAKALTIIRQG